MGDVSKHFSRREFACKCGCGFDSIDAETLQVLEELRDTLREPITITSGCRCAAHNKAVGGSEHSYHLTARAVDISCPLPANYVYDLLDNRYPNKYGLGRYSDWVHVDTRKTMTRWDG